MVTSTPTTFLGVRMGWQILRQRAKRSRWNLVLDVPLFVLVFLPLALLHDLRTDRQT